MSQLIHIVMTPTRNESWVIRAFLESTTRWADYVIICDQFSTDGTREIVQEFANRKKSPITNHLTVSPSNGMEKCPDSALRTEGTVGNVVPTIDHPDGRGIYTNDQRLTTNDQRPITNQPKAEIILIDNPNMEFNEAERQRILVAKAREVAAGRDTLLWGLDADEILASNAFETEDWQRIMNSKPGAVFWFQWAQLTHDKKHYFNTSNSFPWLFHDDGVEPHGNWVREMHSMRIPYPADEHDMTYVNDFRVLHLGPAPLNRVRAKERFYMFVDWQVNHRPPYLLYRQYVGSNAYPKEQFDLPVEWIYTLEKDGWNLLENVQLDESHCWMDDYIYERLNKFPMATLVKLPIWTKEFMAYYHLADPRPWYVRWVHRYLEVTQSFKHNIIIRAIDKLWLKRIKM